VPPPFSQTTAMEDQHSRAGHKSKPRGLDAVTCSICRGTHFLLEQKTYLSRGQETCLLRAQETRCTMRGTRYAGRRTRFRILDTGYARREHDPYGRREHTSSLSRGTTMRGTSSSTARSQHCLHAHQLPQSKHRAAQHLPLLLRGPRGRPITCTSACRGQRSSPEKQHQHQLRGRAWKSGRWPCVLGGGFMGMEGGPWA